MELIMQSIIGLILFLCGYFCSTLKCCTSNKRRFKIDQAIKKKTDSTPSKKKKGKGNKGGEEEEEEWEEDFDFTKADLKMVFLVRKDIKMGVGKIGAQVAHAAVGLCYDIMSSKRNYYKRALEHWNEFGAKKVVLSADNLDHIKEARDQCIKADIPYVIISDAGHTQVAPGTITVLGIGVDASSKINNITGSYKLMN